LHILKGLIEKLSNALDFIISEEATNQSVKGRASYLTRKHAFMDKRFSKFPAYLAGDLVYMPRLTGAFFVV
jgi:hypothetical protein